MVILNEIIFLKFSWSCIELFIVSKNKNTKDFYQDEYTVSTSDRITGNSMDLMHTSGIEASSVILSQ